MGNFDALFLNNPYRYINNTTRKCISTLFQHFYLSKKTYILHIASMKVSPRRPIVLLQLNNYTDM